MLKEEKLGETILAPVAVARNTRSAVAGESRFHSKDFSIEDLSTELSSPEMRTTSLLDTLPAELSRQEKMVFYLYYECQLTH